MFFVFEGIDGSGKTTQARILYKYLLSKNMKVVITHEPTKGFVGRIVKNILQGKSEDADSLTLQMLYIADRADHLNKFIRPNLSEGNVVISDRYFYATIAFGSATGLDRNWLIGIFSKFLSPDAVFVIDLDPETALRRIAKRGDMKERFDKLNTLAKIRDVYRKLGKRYKNYYIIDGNRSIKEINEDIIAITDKILKAPIV